MGWVLGSFVFVTGVWVGWEIRRSWRWVDETVNQVVGPPPVISEWDKLVEEAIKRREGNEK